jgi:hypothetical protein
MYFTKIWLGYQFKDGKNVNSYRILVKAGELM